MPDLPRTVDFRSRWNMKDRLSHFAQAHMDDRNKVQIYGLWLHI